eukprot:INCI527.2.p1 GENE.INCI527.2~~INCI527.2.p1  ORF type:complete len:907 (+),score=134.49 INCI527.2:429-3149(+)
MSTFKSIVIILLAVFVARASCVRLGALTFTKNIVAQHSLQAKANGKGQLSTGSGDASSSASSAAASVQMLAETVQHRAQVGHLHLIFPNTSRPLEDAERALAEAIDAILLRQTNSEADASSTNYDEDDARPRLPHVEVLQEELARTKTAVMMQSQALEIELARTRTACTSKADDFKVIERDIRRRLQSLSEDGVETGVYPGASAAANMEQRSSDGDGGQLRALREMAAKYDKASQSFHRHAAVDIGSAVEALHRHIGLPSGSGGTSRTDEGELADDPLEELMTRHIVQSAPTSLRERVNGSPPKSFAPSSESVPPESKGQARLTAVDPDSMIVRQLREALRSQGEDEAAVGMKCSLSMLRVNQSLADLGHRGQLIDGALAAVHGHYDGLDKNGTIFLQNAPPGARQAVALAHFAMALRAGGQRSAIDNDIRSDLRLLPYRQVLASWSAGSYRFRERSSSVPSNMVVVGQTHNVRPLSASSSLLSASAAPTSQEVSRVNGVPLLPFPQPVYRPPENLDAASTNRYLLSADVAPEGVPMAKNAAPRPTRKPGVSVADKKLKSIGEAEHFTASDLRFIPVPRACDIAGQPCYIEAPGHRNVVTATRISEAGHSASGFAAQGFGLGARRASETGSTSGVGGIDARANCSWHGALELRVDTASQAVPITANAGGPFASPGNARAALSGPRTSGGHRPVVFETIEDALLGVGRRTSREPTAEVPQACACDPGYTGDRCAFCSVGYHKLLHDTGAPPNASRNGDANDDDLYARAPCAQCLAHTDFNSQMFYALPVPLDPSAGGASELRDHLAAVSSNKRVAGAAPSPPVTPDPSIPPRPGTQSLAHALAQPVTIADTPGVAQQRLLTHVDLYLSPLVRWPLVCDCVVSRPLLQPSCVHAPAPSLLTLIPVFVP